MSVNVRFEVDNAALERLLRSADGPVVQELSRRADYVVNGAKRRCPVNTGRLRASITKELGTVNGEPAYFVGTNVQYAPYIHGGTGVYGPRGAPITPVRAQYLVFTPRGSRTRVFARQVRGVRPVPFLTDALADAGG